MERHPLGLHLPSCRPCSLGSIGLIVLPRPCRGIVCADAGTGNWFPRGHTLSKVLLKAVACASSWRGRGYRGGQIRRSCPGRMRRSVDLHLWGFELDQFDGRRHAQGPFDVNRGRCDDDGLAGREVHDPGLEGLPLLFLAATAAPVKTEQKGVDEQQQKYGDRRDQTLDITSGRHTPRVITLTDDFEDQKAGGDAQ